MPTQNELLRQFQQADAAGNTALADELARQYVQVHQASTPGVASGVTRAAAQGLTFGFADEIEARARSLVQDAPYEEIRDEIRESNKAFREDSPVLSYGAELGAGFLVPGGALKAGATLARGAGTMGKVARGIGSALPTSRGGGMVAGGAAEGVLAGAGYSEAQNVGGIATDAIIGGGLGAGLGLGGAALERGLLGKARREGAGEIAMARAGYTPDEIVQRVSDVGPQATLPDASAGMKGLAYSAQSSVPGSKADDYIDFLADRTLGQEARIRSSVETATGMQGVGTRKSAERALKDFRDKEASQLFGGVQAQAQGMPINVSDARRTMIRQDKTVSGIANNVLERMRRRSENYDLSLEDVEGTFEFWHGLQSQMRETAKKMGTPVRPGSIRQEGGDLMEMRQKLLSEMRNPKRNAWGPDYEDAQKAFAKRSASMDAMTDAAQFQKMETADLKELVAGMDVEERTAFTTGVVADLLQKVSTSVESADIARKIIRTKQLKGNLEVLLGSQEQATALIKKLRSESEMLATESFMFKGSQTAPRSAASAAFNEPGIGDIARNAVRLDLPAVVGDMAKIARGPGEGSRMNPKTANTVLDMMQLQNPAEIRRALQNLEMARIRGPVDFMPGVVNAGVLGSMEGY